MSKWVRLLRVKHWIKNLFVYLAAFFGGSISMDSIQILSFAFISFSLVASSIYVLNDFRDLENDKLHPKKKLRPFPSGDISISHGLIVGALCIGTGLAIAYLFLPLSVLLIILLYWTMNVFYSLGLKRLAIIDLVFVATGFVLRVICGAEAVNVELSFWLLMMTFLFSMFVVLAKRRDDFSEGEENAKKLRAVNNSYNLKFLNYSIVIFSSLMLVCYIMYTYLSAYFSQSIYSAFFSSVLVFIGLSRYLQVIFVENKGGNPTEFAYKDKMTLIVLLIWGLHFAYLIYAKS